MSDLFFKFYSFIVGLTLAITGVFSSQQQPREQATQTQAAQQSTPLVEVPQNVYEIKKLEQSNQNPSSSSTEKIVSQTKEFTVQGTVSKKTEQPTSSSLIPEVTTISQNTKPSDVSPQGKKVIDGYDEQNTSDSFLSSQNPCSSIITYKIGTLDPRFSLSKSELLQYLYESSTIWNSAAKKKIFEYSDNGKLTVNLVYDERQLSTQELSYLALEIQNTKNAAEEIRLSYEADKKTYQDLSARYGADVESYNQNFKIYNDKVLSWNEKGGAPQTEYDAMMLEKATLSQESLRLSDAYKNLSLMLDDINGRIKKYNELIAYVNTLIKRNNSYGTMTFTEGRYSSSNNTIDIYQYSTVAKLKRVLIHEMGHALSLPHNDSPSSIMYYMNSGVSTTLTSTDIKDLEKTCLLP